MLSEEILRIIPQFIRVIRKLSTNQLDGSVTLHHLRVLVLVSEGQGTSQMADTLQISLPAVSKVVNNLVERILLKRNPGEDRRCINLSLTPRGSKILNLVKKEVSKDLQVALNKLTKEECVELEKGLRLLDKVMIHLKEAK